MNRNQQKQWFILLATIFFILISLDHCQTLIRLMVATADFLQSRAVLHLLWWLALLLLILAWANCYVSIGKLKANFNTWLKSRFFQSERPIQVMIAGSVSLALLVAVTVMVGILVSYGKLAHTIWSTGAFWTLAVLFVSSPVAFVVWRFRDENQSKDINLKEFQKISEWVTGAHLPDAEKIKVTGKQKHDELDTTTQSQNDELGIEFNMPAKSKQALHSFSKQDGAVGLQIAAVYNLLPFYRGDYGQAFEKPSVHLLHSAWQVLQHDILQELENADDDETRKDLIKQLHQRADSPLGQAITRVLLACDYAKKPLLHRHPEILPGICLSGMDFKLAGLETEILRDTLFRGQNLRGAQWQGVREMNGWDLSQAMLKWANLSGAGLGGANLSGAGLGGANLSGAGLYKANLSGAGLDWANLNGAGLNLANLNGAGLNLANLSGAGLNWANLSGANLLYAEDLSTEQLLAAETLAGSLTDADNFSQYTHSEQQQLQEKGLIVLHEGSDTVPEYLLCKHKTKQNWKSIYPADSIPFPINLAATQAANPDWEISIE